MDSIPQSNTKIKITQNVDAIKLMKDFNILHLKAI